jgi:DNA-binding XRE family transcriptional regulator/flagellar motor component MotA
MVVKLLSNYHSLELLMSVSIEKLKKLRKHSGWSQERLAEISGLSLRTIQRIETSGNASLESQLAMATAFSISPGELLANEIVEIGNGGINWGGIIGILLCVGLMIFQFDLGNTVFFDPYSLLLMMGLSIAISSISMGIDNTLTTVLLIRWVFVLPKHKVGMQKYLPDLNKLITYCHVSGGISSLVGLIAVLMTLDPHQYQPDAKYPLAIGIGVALLTSLYAAMLAELILRPLKHQIERLLIQHQKRLTPNVLKG